AEPPARPAAGAARPGPGGAPEGGAPGGQPGGARGRDAAPAVRGDDARAAATRAGLAGAGRCRLGWRDAAEAGALLRRRARERRPREEELARAIAEINQVLEQVLSREQRDVFLGSNLDAVLLETERETLRRRELVAERKPPSLESYLPLRGSGLMLSATDIDV